MIVKIPTVLSIDTFTGIIRRYVRNRTTTGMWVLQCNERAQALTNQLGAAHASGVLEKFRTTGET